uniref:Uncharacterized protein n=1 Tax=viral metagenome TaxID=1070528 RepID=A0A2V0RBB0_9ZZZZ
MLQHILTLEVFTDNSVKILPIFISDGELSNTLARERFEQLVDHGLFLNQVESPVGTNYYGLIAPAAFSALSNLHLKPILPRSFFDSNGRLEAKSVSIGSYKVNDDIAHGYVNNLFLLFFHVTDGAPSIESKELQC